MVSGFEDQVGSTRPWGVGGAILYARVSAIATVILGGGTLLGWMAGAPLIVHSVAPFSPMLPSVGFGLALGGAAVFILTFTWGLAPARALASLAGLIGLLGLLQHLALTDWSIEHLLRPQNDDAVRQRVSPFVALSLIFFAGAMLIAQKGRRLRPLVADTLVMLILVMALATLIGYGFAAEGFYRHTPDGTASLQGAIGLVLLGTATLAASPERGLMASLVDTSPGGQLLRRLLPVVMLAPFALGWIVQQGVALGWFDPASEMALVALLTIVWLAMIVWVTAEIVRSADLARQDAEWELSRQREWLMTTLASIGDAVIATNPHGAVLIMNRCAEELTGWSASETTRRRIHDVFLSPDEASRRTMIEAIRTTLHSRSPERAEALLLTRDRRQVPVEVSGAPIVGSEGQLLGAVFVLRDMTEQRRDEQRQAMLMGELNHRVKNVLAVVQSLVQASARRAPTGPATELATALTQRIQSLSNAHQLLLETQWSGARFRAMVERELAPYREDGLATVTVRGPDILLPPECTSILAMTLHELATNAAKYGALARPEGRLSVVWRSRDEMLTILWRERHDGTMPRGKDGFGLQLIERGIEQNLGGDSWVDFRDGGLRVQLKVPLVRPAASGIDAPGSIVSRQRETIE